MYSANVVITLRILYFFPLPSGFKRAERKTIFLQDLQTLLFTHLAVSFYVRHLYSTGSSECWKSVSLQGISVSYKSSSGGVRFATWQLLEVLSKSTHAVAANIMQLDCFWWLWMGNCVLIQNDILQNAGTAVMVAFWYAADRNKFLFLLFWKGF